MKPIYLDSHATTPLDPRVLDAMMPYLTERFGNAASDTHAVGAEAAQAVETARESIAGALDVSPREIVFTSGATEANNLAIKGVVEQAGIENSHVVTCATEHPSVLDPLRRLEKRGLRLTVLPVAPDGTLDMETVRAALSGRTVLVSIMHANNEIGVIHDLEKIGAICAQAAVPLHTDATQTAGKIPVQANRLGVRLMSFSAHKFHGPKGVGALCVRKSGRPRLRLSAQLDGGGHERGLRSGTLNVPGIVGMARALEICQTEMGAEQARLGALRDRLRDKLVGELNGVRENGTATNKLTHNLNVSFDNIDSVTLLNRLPGLAVSTGAACSSAKPDPSHVLLALGGGEERARSSVRFGLHRFNTEEEIDRAAAKVIEAVKELRALVAS